MLTRSSLFSVLNTINYSVSQLVGQKCWVCSPKVGCETVLRGSRIEYSQRNDINKKRNSNRGLHGLKTEARTRPVPEIVRPDPSGTVKFRARTRPEISSESVACRSYFTNKSFRAVCARSLICVCVRL